MSWDDVGLVLASTYRRNILNTLKKGPRTPSIISRETSLRIEHVSRTLSELEARDLVEILTPRRKRGKLYGLTSKGRKVIEKISELEITKDTTK